MPQCTIGRVSFPWNLGSSQMCGLSGASVLSATRCGGSYRRSHTALFNPGWPAAVNVRTTVPASSRMSKLTGPAVAFVSE